MVSLPRVVPRRTRDRVLAGLVVLLVVAGAVVWFARPDGTAFRTHEQTVTVRTGPSGAVRVPLDTTLYTPDTATRVHPAPAVLIAHGFGATKDSVVSQARKLARRGYVVLAWTAEGFGSSGGQIHLDSPDWEVTDARRLLDWLADRPEVRRDGPGDPRVGVVGDSYGGALALLLAAADHRVDAIVPQITWHDLGGSLFPESSGGPVTQGVLKRAWLGSLFTGGLTAGRPGRPGAPGRPGGTTATPGCGRFAPEVCQLYRQVMTTGRADPATARLLRNSSPAPVLGQIHAPTLLVQGLADTLFGVADADANARGIAAAGTPVRVAWYSGGHDGGAGSATDQDRIDYLSAQWLDHYVKGTGPVPGDSFTFSRTTGYDRYDATVRSTGFDAGRYPGLIGDRPATRIALVGGPQPVANPPAGTPSALSSLPGAGALGGRTTEIPGQAAVFGSAALRHAVDLVGAPRVAVRAVSSSGSAVLLVKLYDVGPDGRRTLVAGQAAPVRLTGLPRTAAGLGSAPAARVTLPGMVYRFAQGHRVEVVVDTADQAYTGPSEPANYVVGLDGGAVRLPAVAAQPLRDPAGVWYLLLAGLAVLIVLAVLAAVLIARVRRRRRQRAMITGYADIPLRVTGLRKTYRDGFVAVRGVDFEVHRGEVVGLLGPNGAGKTTSLRMLLGLIRPTGGEVLVFGHQVSAGAPVLSRIGSLAEGPGFLPHLSGVDNLRLYWRSTGRPWADARLDEALDIAGLGDAVRRRVRTYSHGMKQRLAIAQAMLGLPELLVLDEPTDGLDPPQIAEMRRVLQRYATGQRAVLVSSHLLAEVEQTCTHVVVLRAGERVAAGPVADIVGDSPSVQLHVSDPDAAEQVLRGLSGLASVDRADGGFVVELAELPRTGMVEALVSAGIGVDRVVPRRRLEDAFLALLERGD